MYLLRDIVGLTGRNSGLSSPLEPILTIKLQDIGGSLKMYFNRTKNH